MHSAKKSRKQIKSILLVPPFVEKCIVCLSNETWKSGVTCAYTLETYKAHFVCQTCFLTMCKSALRFPFSCPFPDCKTNYTQGHILHIKIPEMIEKRWNIQALSETKLETDTWECPSCHYVSWLDKSYNGSTIRCPNTCCRNLFCRFCNQKAHYGRFCEQSVPGEKDEESKLKTEFRKSNVILLKCPSLSCVKQPPIFRGSACNRLKCPLCKNDLCGNCGDDLTFKVGHFCDDPYLCEKLNCKHCPLYSKEKQVDIDVLDCGKEKSIKTEDQQKEETQQEEAVQEEAQQGEEEEEEEQQEVEQQEEEPWGEIEQAIQEVSEE